MCENYCYETCINNIDVQNNIHYCISLKNNNTQGLLFSYATSFSAQCPDGFLFHDKYEGSPSCL